MPNFWTVSQRDNRICNRIYGNVTGRMSCNWSYDKIVSYLKGDEVSNRKSKEEKHFRHYVKKTGFKLLDFPAVGLRDALVVPVKEEKVVSRFFLGR